MEGGSTRGGECDLDQLPDTPPTPPPKDKPVAVSGSGPKPVPLRPAELSRKPMAFRPPQPKVPMSSRPQLPLGMNPPTRPGTAASRKSARPQMAALSTPRKAGSTTRFSLVSYASSKKRIKYGTGKYSHLELVPQPSDDPDDALNWPWWRKELNFWSLLLVAALAGVQKTSLTSVNGLLAQALGQPYARIAALTGVPLIMSALSGLASLAGSRIWGKRPCYLAAVLFLFTGTVWNAGVASYAQCMASRVFQGLGWGVFDALVLASILDTYFEHERSFRMGILSVVSGATAWGGPLLGGAVSQNGLGLHSTIIGVFFVIAIPAVVLGAPETTYDRSGYMRSHAPATASSDQKTISVQVHVRKTLAFQAPAPIASATLLQPLRAFVAPTTLLIVLVSCLPLAALWSLTQSLAFHLPTLSPSQIGTIFAGPCLLSTLTTIAFAWWFCHTNIADINTTTVTTFSQIHHMLILAVASLLALIGTILFGVRLPRAGSIPGPGTNTYSVDLAAFSILLALLAASFATLDSGIAIPLVKQSTQFTAPCLTVADRCTGDMLAAVGVWRVLVAGVIVIVLTAAEGGARPMSEPIIAGMGTTQLVLAMGVAAAWCFSSGAVRRLDGRVLGLVDLWGC